MENSVWGYVNNLGNMAVQARNLARSRERPTVSDPLYLTKFPGMVHYPTR